MAAKANHGTTGFAIIGLEIYPHFAMDLPAHFNPFSTLSAEPRFAFEFSYCTLDAISLGLTLCQYCQYAGKSAKFSAVDGKAGWLAVRVTNGHGLPRLAPTPEFFTDLTNKAAARRILSWLKKSPYPPQPWFEGGESRGFRMFHVPWDQEPVSFYGYTVIQPKWFEVHK
jgi:hypothetical protein